MNSDRRANLQRKLTLTPVPKPPSGLADKIKGEIPKHLLFDTERERQRLSQSVAFNMRVAASILLLVSGLYVGLHLMSQKSEEQKPVLTPTRQARRVAQPTDTFGPQESPPATEPEIAKVARAKAKPKEERVLADKKRDTAPTPAALAAPTPPPPPAALAERVEPLAAKSANVVAQQAGATSRFGVSLDRADRSTTALVQQFAPPAALPPHGVQLDVEAVAAPFEANTQLLRISIDAADAATDALLNVDFDSGSVTNHRAIVSIHSTMIGRNTSRTLLHRFELTPEIGPGTSVVTVRLRYRTNDASEETLETTLRRADVHSWQGASSRMKGAALAASLGEALRVGGDRSAIAAEARRVGLPELAALAENPQP
jgi:hypothetical protein